MNAFIKLISIAAVTMVLTACGGGSDDTPEGSNLGKSTYLENWNNVKIGMGTGPVKRLLGQPDQVKATKTGFDYVYEKSRIFIVETAPATETEAAKRACKLVSGSVTFANNYVSAVNAPGYLEGSETFVYELTAAEAWAYKTRQPNPCGN